MTKQEFTKAHKSIARSVSVANRLMPEYGDKVVCLNWSSAVLRLCDGRQQEYNPLGLAHHHCNTQLVSACRELNAGVFA